MNIDSIRYFRTVVETGSIRAASDLLKVTPAAISKSLKRLESDFEKVFFINQSNTLKPTDDALFLYQHSSRLIEEFSSVTSVFQRKEPVLRKVRIGTFEVFSTFFIADAITKELSEIPLIVSEMAPGIIEDACSKAAIDMGITYVPMPRPSIEYVATGQLTFGIYVSSAAIEKYKNPLDSLGFAIPISSIEGTPLEIQGLDGWPISAPPRKISYRFEMLQTALLTTSLGHSAIFLPDFIAKLFNNSIVKERQLKRLPDHFNDSRVSHTVYLVKASNKEESNDFRSLAKALRRILR